MGFFDKFKQKLTEKVEQFTEKVSQVSENITSQVSTVVEKATENIVEVVKSAPILQFNKLKDGLSKTRNTLSKNILGLLGAGRKIDQKLLDEIEEALILADIGVKTTTKIIERLKVRVKQDKLEHSEQIYATLKEEIYNLLITSPSAHNDKIYATEIDCEIEADTWFPNIDNSWKIESVQEFKADEKNQYDYKFINYVK
jgi:signal recognition particle GTPase